MTKSKLADAKFTSTHIGYLNFENSNLTAVNFNGAYIYKLLLCVNNTANNANFTDIHLLQLEDEQPQTIKANIVLPRFALLSNIRFLNEDHVKDTRKLKSRLHELKGKIITLDDGTIVSHILAMNIINVIKEIQMEPHAALNVVNIALKHFKKPQFKKDTIVKEAAKQIKHKLAFFGVCSEPVTGAEPLVEFKKQLEARLINNNNKHRRKP